MQARSIPKRGEKYPVLDYGHVIYVDHMGDDMDIVDAARVSYKGEGKSSDRDLLRYLLRNRHTSPFEMCEIKVIIKCPIFVARQLVRHRTASLNEVSGRYTELPDEQFSPARFPKQSSSNKQGRTDEDISPQSAWSLDLSWRRARDAATTAYRDMLKMGVAKEIARCVLPLSQYTEFVWKIDLHNLMHFLALRLDEHAQYEIRVFADALNELAWRLWPNSMEAFHDYVVEGVTLSRFERDMVMYMLRTPYPGNSLDAALKNLQEKYVDGGAMSEREWTDFVTKFRLHASGGVVTSTPKTEV